jgi:hypothetical protein
MRLPFPERITLWHAGCFAFILCAFELLLGTAPLFVACVFAYIMMATVAFNLAGGLYRASGAYIFANSVLGLIISQCAKVGFGEAADANLRDPTTSILVYMAGMAAILLAVVISRRFIPKMSLLERGDVPEDNRQIGIGCIAMGIAMPFITGFMGGGNGSLSSALNQFSEFLPLGLVLATYDEIRSTQGRKSLNIFIVSGSLFMIGFWGILCTSKQGLFTPLAAYLIVCGAMRYRFRLQGIIGIALVCIPMFYYLVPYSQVVRNYTRSIDDWGTRIDTSIYWLSHLDEVRAEYTKDSDLGVTGPHYYNEDRGFMERLGTIAMDDALIDTTDSNGRFGYEPMLVAIENIVPHAIWADKPEYTYNNTYAHEIGILSEDDATTSVSFGPSADGYHMGGWPGVLVLMPIVMTFLFIVVDSVSGSIKKTPWGLIYTVYFLHAGPEVSLGGCMGAATQETGIIVVTIYAARYVLPFVGSVLFPERRRSVLMRNVREFPKTAGAPPETAIEPV